MAIGFGIIGCGMILRFHCRAINEIEGARVVACYNRTFDNTKTLAGEFDIEAHESLDEMLARDDVDAVAICTASGAHMEPAIAAAKAGKHVVIEKPLEVTLERCDRIIQECEKAGVVLSTIFPSRFHKCSQLLKAAIDDGRFGRLTLGDAYVKWFRSQEYYDSGAWRGTWELDGGGALMNQAIHSVDLLVWLMGPVAEINAQTSTLGHERIEVEDVATASLKFENGALGVIEATTAAYPGWLKKIEIHGTEGSVQIEEEDIKRWEFAKMTAKDEQLVSEFAGATKTGGGAADPAAIGHAAHADQFHDVIKAIKDGGSPLIDGHEGRKSVEVILAIYQAARTGKTVKLPLKKDPVVR